MCWLSLQPPDTDRVILEEGTSPESETDNGGLACDGSEGSLRVPLKATGLYSILNCVSWVSAGVEKSAVANNKRPAPLKRNLSIIRKINAG